MKQLELNLTPRSELHGSIEPWVYRYDKGALIEELDTRRYVYGLWDKVFGCWKVNTGAHTSMEIVPRWIPLNTGGVWRDPLDVRFENTPKAGWLLSPKWRYEANAAFAAYFSSIPYRIRSLVAPLRQHQWLGLDMIWQVPEFAHFLDEEFFNNTQQYVFACLALGEMKNLSRAKRRDFASKVIFDKRTELLSQLSNGPVSKKVVRFLPRLGEVPFTASTYQSLINFIMVEEASKALLHATDFDPAALHVLNKFPAGFLTSNMVRIILDDPGECELLCDYMEYEPGEGFRTVIGMYPALPNSWQDRLRNSLGTLKGSGELSAWGDRWAQRLTEIISFPAPPFRAFKDLIPLATARALRQEALAMHNCVSQMVGRVLSGEVFFYSWDGPEAATVMLKRGPHDEWRFAEAHGYDNQQLDTRTLLYIENVVNAALSTGDRHTS